MDDWARSQICSLCIRSLRVAHVATEPALDAGGHDSDLRPVRSVEGASKVPVGGRPAAKVRLFPEAGDQGPHQQLLGQANLGMGRHFQGPQFERSLCTAALFRSIQLVNAEFGPVGVSGDVYQ